MDRVCVAQRKANWYHQSEHEAEKALNLAKAVLSGKSNFVYDKSQLDDADDDDDE